MPQGIHGVRKVKAYQVNDAKGSLFIDMGAAIKAARRAEFERRVKAWVEKAIGGQPLRQEFVWRRMLNDANAAVLNEAFKMYNGNSDGVQKNGRKVRRKVVKKVK